MLDCRELCFFSTYLNIILILLLSYAIFCIVSSLQAKLKSLTTNSFPAWSNPFVKPKEHTRLLAPTSLSHPVPN